MAVSLQGRDPEQGDKLVDFMLHFDYSNDFDNPGAGEIQDATGLPGKGLLVLGD